MPTKKENDFRKLSEKVSKLLLEYCIKYEIINPKIQFDINCESEKYKMIFERTDLD